jgi:hypothetical protein
MAAVRGTMRIAAVPGRFGGFLDQVNDAARAGHVRLDGQNIFLYRPSTDGGTDDEIDIDFGVAPAERGGSNASIEVWMHVR